MALVATRAPRLGNLVKAEYMQEHGFCREIVTVNFATETNVVLGSVLGKVTATGKFGYRDPAGTDGTEIASAVAIENKLIPAATNTDIAVFVRGPLILGRDALVWGIAHDATQKASAEAELEALDMIVRTQV